MRLSVITVCLNARDTIEDALVSIHGQTQADKEHIVVDGASTDGTLDIVERHRAGIKTVISGKDPGLYYAMNKGIAAATGDYVGFLNSDDVYANPDVLAKVAKAAETHRVDAVHGDLLYVSAADTSKVIRYWKSKPHRPGAFEAGWHPAHPTLFVRTELLRELGGFDTSYRYHADFDLMVRLFIERRISSAYIPEVLVRMRTGGQSNRSIRNIYRGNLESYSIARQFGVARSPLWLARKLAFRVAQFFRRPPVK